MAAFPALDFRPAQELNEHQQAIDCFAILGEGEDNVLDCFEAPVRTDIAASRKQWLAGFDDAATVLPDLVWCPLMLDFGKPRTRVVSEKIFRHVGADQAVSEIRLRFASDIQDYGVRHKPGDIGRIDIRSGWQAAPVYLFPPVQVTILNDSGLKYQRFFVWSVRGIIRHAPSLRLAAMYEVQPECYSDFREYTINCDSGHLIR
jgi:hypothetical protein